MRRPRQTSRKGVRVHNGLKEPHIFNASSNPLKLIKNLTHILTQNELDKIRKEIDLNVIGLFELGETHYNFASNTTQTEWRQRISRLYYGAYNIRRAVALKYDGWFSTDSSDHKKVETIPDAVQNAALYRTRLINLREDRNLADYSHLAKEVDLLHLVSDYEQLVGNFLMDAKVYLQTQGVAL